MDELKNKLQGTIEANYRKKCSPSFFPYLFGIPFGIGAIVFLIVSIQTLLEGNSSGLFLLLGTVAFFGVSYFLGWRMLIVFVRGLNAIKKKEFTLIRATCKANTTETVSHSEGTLTKSKLTFENSGGAYPVKAVGTTIPAQIGSTYILIFLASSKTANMIYCEETDQMLYCERS